MVNDDDYRPPRRRRPAWLLALLALVLVAGAAVGVPYFLDRADVCGEGVRKEGPKDECVGVTDGRYVFDPALAGISGKIAKANKDVKDSGKPWVSVAYLQPLTFGPDDKGKDSVREELEGAYLAQRALNSHREGGEGDVPQIRLLLASPGAGAAQWQPLVKRILDMRGGDDRVVAVAGLGQSLDTTLAAVGALRAARMPMIGSTVTADSLSDPAVAGFFRIVPPNAQEASAAAKYLKGGQRPGQRVQIIKDRNASNIYARSLYDGFVKAADRLGLARDSREFPFESGTDGVENAMASIADKVCDQQVKPQAVFFAARGRELRTFIEAAQAGGRVCPVTLLTGDDAIGMFYDIPLDTERAARDLFDRRWKASGVTVLNTAMAHPAMIPLTSSFVADYRKAFGGEQELQNGLAMLGHDALLTAGSAIRDAAGDGKSRVTPESVINMLLQLSDTDAVAGLTGTIRFGQDSGDPTDKTLALVQLTSDPKQTYHHVRVITP
ncbi:hypothetical protein ABT160_33625 [Streptomyces sp. NPDC001941]|uniref:hypothetical protein n=1 Tax=Streptomyces sp. NPDC001941 TaxID=3154659 RepID=UPI003316D07D